MSRRKDHVEAVNTLRNQTQHCTAVGLNEIRGPRSRTLEGATFCIERYFLFVPFWVATCVVRSTRFLPALTLRYTRKHGPPSIRLIIISDLTLHPIVIFGPRKPRYGTPLGREADAHRSMYTACAPFQPQPPSAYCCFFRDPCFPFNKTAIRLPNFWCFPTPN